MKPDVPEVLQTLAGHLALAVAPTVQPAYAQASLGMTAAVLGMAAEQWDGAAARLVEENAALRRLFADARSAVESHALAARLEAAATGTDPGLEVSVLTTGNHALRRLLIELHAHVEERGDDAARRIDEAIWSELVRSTERRQLAGAPF